MTIVHSLLAETIIIARIVFLTMDKCLLKALRDMYSVWMKKMIMAHSKRSRYVSGPIAFSNSPVFKN